ncbi:MAG: hypothetical protein DHS20C20_02210 [Ardenticatenaceae bacterium]|nr:MAG: hypothetical protein DHS20C20_02210 [Ardenticatenaceae bacterium]
MNLQTIDNFTRKLGLINNLIDMIMRKILPKTIALAGDCGHHCGGTFRGDFCHYSCENCVQYAVYQTMGWFAPSGGGPCENACPMGCTWKVAGGTCGGPC